MTKITHIIIWFFLLPVMVYAEQVNSSAIFKEGIKLFQEADSMQLSTPDSAQAMYLQAARRFEFLIKHKEIDNGHLYYNAGNAYFRANELGKAIYNYKMAELFIPYNKDLKNSLTYATSMVEDIPETNPKSLFARFIHSIQQMPYWIKALLLIFVYGAFWLFRTQFFREKTPAFYRTLSLVLLIPLVGIFIISIFNKHKSGIIFNDKVLVKKGNSLAYEDAFYNGLNKGTEFKLLETRGDWLKIELIDGKLGWIEKVNAGIIE